VRSIAKPFLLLGTILLGIYLLLLLAANITLQLPEIKDRVHAMLIRALCTPVYFQNLFLSPSFGIRLQGINVTPTSQLPMASADSLTMHPSWGALMKGKLIPRSITLNRPVVILRLGAPTLTATGISLPFPSPSAPPLHAGSSSVPTHLQGSFAENKSGSSPDLAHLLEYLSVRNGKITLIDAISHPFLLLSDLRASAEKGLFKIFITSATLNDSLKLHNLMAEAGTEGSSLSLKNISAIMGDGLITGNLRCGLPPESPDYNCSLQLAGANLNKLLADASLGSPSAEGRIDGELILAGTAGNGSTMTGKGSIRCNESTIEPVDFLKQIGQLLNIDELKLLRLSEGRCLFRIDHGHVVIDELFLRSENLTLSAVGPLQPSGELNLDSRLLLNEKLSGRLRGLLGKQLSPAPESGYSQLSFHVTGPVNNPRTDLVERLTGIHFGGNLGGLLQGLFGKPPQSPQQPPASLQPSH